MASSNRANKVAEVEHIENSASAPSASSPDPADTAPAAVDDKPVDENNTGSSGRSNEAEASAPSRSPFTPQVIMPGEAGSDDPPQDLPGNLIFVRRDIPSSSGSRGQWNAPPISGPWEFVPGLDTSLAVVGQPEPQKFFIIRQKTGNHSKKDVRQYPGWEKFDWYVEVYPSVVLYL